MACTFPLVRCLIWAASVFAVAVSDGAGECASNLSEETSLLQHTRPRAHLGEPQQPQDVQAAQALEGLWPEPCNEMGQSIAEQIGLCAIAREKRPNVWGTLLNRPSEEAGMTDEQKKAFEVSIARKIYDTDVIEQTTREFARRLYGLIVLGSKEFLQLSEDDALTQAFAPKCSVHNTGFPGAGPSTIKDVLLKNGNLREVWCLVYCLIKNEPFLDHILEKSDADFMQRLLGEDAGRVAAGAVAERKTLVDLAAKLPASERYTWGTADYTFPAKNSWVNFGFDAYLPKKVGGELLWHGARRWKGCREVDFIFPPVNVFPPVNNEAEIVFPPISHRELIAQCNGTKPPCKFHWHPGDSCWEVRKTSLYAERAAAKGYRMVAGPSGTTANALQLARSLGFTTSDMPLFRAVMAAWLVPANDHSFMEVMLAAEPFMSWDASMQWGSKDDDYADFRRLWPKDLVVKASWGPTFRGLGSFLP